MFFLEAKLITVCWLACENANWQLQLHKCTETLLKNSFKCMAHKCTTWGENGRRKVEKRESGHFGPSPVCLLLPQCLPLGSHYQQHNQPLATTEAQCVSFND